MSMEDNLRAELDLDRPIEIDVYGGGGGGKTGGGSASSAPDTLFSTSTVKVLGLITEGESGGVVGGLKGVYRNDVAIQNSDGSFNFKGIVADFRTGTPDQAYMEGFPGVQTPKDVGVVVRQSTPVVATLSDPTFDRVRVTLAVGALFLQKSDGSVRNNSVNYRIEIAYYNGPWISQGDFTITGKNSSGYYRQHEFTLPKNPSGAAAPWSIRVTRISTDDDAANAANNKFTSQSTLTFFQITGLIDTKFTYPSSALIGLSVTTSQLGDSIGEVRVLTDGIKVPVPSNRTVNADRSRTYSGVWDGTFKEEVCDNPIWLLNELVINDRFGLGQFVDAAGIDKAAFYEISRYCDVLVSDGAGGMEPRYTFNGVITNQTEAYDLLQMVAQVYRGMVYWSTGTITSTQDRPGDVKILVTEANVIDGELKYSSSARKARHTVAMVSWHDPKNLYRENIEFVENADGIALYGYNPVKIDMLGCTSRGQAYRAGLWTLYTELFETQIVSYRAGLDHAVVRPGDLIAVQDPQISNLDLSGRLRSSSTTTTLYLDHPITLTAGVNYSIAVTLRDGTVQEKAVQSSTTGSDGRTILTLASALSSAPDDAAVWQIAGNIVPQKFRVISIKEDEPNIYSVTALEHEPSKFAAIDNGATFTETQFTEFPYVVLPPTNLTVREGTYTENQVPKQALTLSWTAGQPFNSVGYYVTIVKPSGDIVNLPRTASTSIDILDASVGTYRFLVTAIGLTGKVSLATETTYVMAGWAGELGATVTGLATSAGGSTFGGRSATVKWSHTFPTGRGAYTVRNVVRIFDASTSALLRTVVLPLGLTQYTYEYTDNVNDGGPRRQFRISVTAQSPAGVEGNATSLLVSNPAPVAPSFSLTNLGLGFMVKVTDPGDSDLAGTIVFASKTSPVALTDANARDIGYGFSSNFAADAGDTWYVRVACYDAFSKAIGGLSVAPEQTVTISSNAFDVGTPSIPGKPTIATSSIDTSSVDGNVTAYIVATWAASSGSFSDLYEYQLKLGTGNWGDIRGASGNTVEVHGLLPSTGYTIRVRAVSTNRIKSSGWSPETTFTTAKSTVAPANPTDATVSGGFEKAVLSWTPSTSLDVRYIEVWSFVGTSTAASPASGSTIAYRAPADATGYTDTIATTGTETYWLRAVSTSGVPAASYVLVGSATSAQIQKGQLVDKAIDASKIALGLTLSEIIDDSATGLPTTGNYKGRQAYWQGKNYYYNGTKWVPVVTYGNAAGDKLTKDQLEQLQLADLGGSLTAPQIAGITGLTATQISSVNVTTLTASAGQYLSKSLIDKLDLTQVSGLASGSNPSQINGAIIDRLRVTQLYGNTGDTIPKNLIATLDLNQISGLASPTNPSKVDGTIIDRLRVTQLYGNAGDYISGTLIDNLDAGKLNTGFLDMSRLADNSLPQRVIAAGSILASKLLLVDTTNLFQNPVFDNASADSWSGLTVVTASAAPSGAAPTASIGRIAMGTGTSDAVGTSFIPVTPGETYYMSADVCGTSGAVNTCSLYIRRYDGARGSGAPAIPAGTLAGPATPTTAWQTLSGQYTIPAGVYFIIAGLRVNANAGAVASTFAYVTNFRLRKAASAELLVDGSITTRVLAAQSVTARTVAIADFQNLVNNGDFAQGISDGWHSVGVSVTTSPPSGCPTRQAAVLARVSTGVQITTGQASDTDTNLDYGISCNAGDSYFYEAWVNQTASGATLVQLLNRAAGGGITTAQSLSPGTPLNTWTRVSGVLTATVSGRAYLRILNQFNNSTVYITQVRLQRRNAGQLVVDGTIVGQHIAANQITARQLVLSDFENQILNGDFSQGLDGWTTMAGVDAAGPSGVSLPAGAPSTTGVRLTRTSSDVVLSWNSGVNFDATAGIPCQIGDVYAIECWAYSTVAAGNNYLLPVATRSTDGSVSVLPNTLSPSIIPANTWTRVTGTWTSTINGRFYPRVLNQTNNSTLHVALVRIQKKNAAQLIVDGSIVGNMILGNTITGDKIRANAITATHMVLSDTQNLLQNGDFRYGVAADWRPSGTLATTATVVDVSGVAGTPAYTALAIPAGATGGTSNGADPGPGTYCSPGDQFTIEAWFRADADQNNTPMFIQGVVFSASGIGGGQVGLVGVNNLVANVWKKYTVVFTANAYGRMLLSLPLNNPTTRILVTGVRFMRRNAADLIVDGSIVANQIAANQITARHLVLGDFENQITNGDFSQGLDGWVLGTAGIDRAGTGGVSLPAGGPSTTGVRLTRTTADVHLSWNSGTNFDLTAGIPCQTGDAYSIEFWAYSTVAAGTGFIFPVSLRNNSGAYTSAGYGGVSAVQLRPDAIPANTWTRLTGTWTAADNGRFFPRFLCQTNNSTLYITSIRIQKKNAAQLIVDGSIVGNQIAANEINATHLTLSDFQNLLMNGDFRYGSGADWVYGGTVSVSVADVSGTSGAPAPRALLFSSSSTGYVQNGSPSSLPTAGQAGTACNAGDQFYAEAWVRSDTAISGSTAYLQGIQIPADGSSAGQAGLYRVPATAAGTWVRITAIFTAGVSGRMVLRFSPSTHGGQVWVTGLRFQRMNAADLVVDGTISARKLLVGGTVISNILPQGEFLDRLAGWDKTESSQYQIVASGGPTATPFLRLNRGVTDNSVSLNVLSLDYIPLAVGTTVELGFWVRGSAASSLNGLRARLSWYDDSRAFVSATDVFSNTTPVTTSWVYKSGQASVPPGVRYVRVQFYHHSDSNIAILDVGSITLRLQVGGTMIADDGITTGKIAVDAVESRSVKAESITAGKILLTDTGNSVTNGDFFNGSLETWTVPAGTVVSAAAANDPGGRWRLLTTAVLCGTSNYFAVNPGDVIYISAMVFNQRAGEAYIRLEISDSLGGSAAALNSVLRGTSDPSNPDKATTQATSTWTRLEGRCVIPSGYGRARVQLIAGSDGSPCYWGKVQARRAASAELIVDGSIVANKISAGSIYARHIVANQIMASHLAVSSINIVPNGDYSQSTMGVVVSGSGASGTSITLLKNGGPGNLNAARVTTAAVQSGAQVIVNQFDTAPSGATSRFAVAGSQYYEASAYIASSTGVTARAEVYFYDNSGNQVGTILGNFSTPPTSITGSTDTSRRVFGFGTSPSGAATATVRVLFSATAAISSPYFIVAGFMMAPAQPGQTEISPFVSPGLTTLDGSSIRTGTVDATTINTTTLNAATGFISVLGASILKAGVITADMVAVGLGSGNQLMNSDFEAGRNYWSYGTGQSGAGSNDLTPDSPQFGVSRWNLRSTSTGGYLQLTYRRPKGGTTPTGEPIPVFPGRRYELSVFTASTAAAVPWIYIQWLDASGNTVGTTVSASGAQVQPSGGAPGVLDAAHKGGSGGIYGGTRLGVLGVAPAGATQANIILRSVINDPNSVTSQTWFTCPYFGEVTQSVYDATTNPTGVKDGDYIFSPWAPMSVSIIDGGTLATGTVIADSVVAGSITSDSISITDKIKGAKIQINDSDGLINTINLTATNKITAGKILLTGSQDLTSLLTGDQTEINGGMISANTIRTESLSIGSRGISVIGLEFFMPRNSSGAPTSVLQWNGGKILYIGDTAPNVGKTLTATIANNYTNNISTGGAPYYVFWQKGSSGLTAIAESDTANLNARLGDPNWVIMATVSSATGIIPMYGGSYLDGTKIISLSIQAAQIAAGAINAGHIASISSTAVDAAISQLSAGKITAGNISTSDDITLGSDRFRLSSGDKRLTIVDNSNVTRVQLGNIGGSVYGLRLFASNGALIMDTTGAGSVSAGSVSGELAVANIPTLDGSTKLSDGSVTGAKVGAGTGNNLLPNSDYERGQSCWRPRINSLAGAFLGVDTGGMLLLGGHVLTVTVPATGTGSGTSGNYMDLGCYGMANNGVVVEPSSRYEFSAWIACRGSLTAQLVYFLFDSSGNDAGSGLVGLSQPSGGGARNTLASYARRTGFITTPSNAALMVCGVRFSSTATGALSYGSITRMFLSKAKPNQTEFSDWSGYTPQAKIDKNNIGDYMDASSGAPITDTYISSIVATKVVVTGGLSSMSADLGTVTAGLIRSSDSKMQIDLSNGRILISD